MRTKRKIRILIASPGLDGHDRGAKLVARALRDAGMEVIYAGRFNMPPMIVKTSIEENVDVIGLSCHSWEYLYYTSELIELLKEKGVEIPVVVGGSVITSGDVKRLKEMGVAAAFGPSSTDEEIIETIKKILSKRY